MYPCGIDARGAHGADDDARGQGLVVGPRALVPSALVCTSDASYTSMQYEAPMATMPAGQLCALSRDGIAATTSDAANIGKRTKTPSDISVTRPYGSLNCVRPGGTVHF